MKHPAKVLACIALAQALCIICPAQQTSHEAPLASVVQANLIAPDSPPFHLKAIITERGDPDYRAEVEMFWLSPDKWRRTIQSNEFTQTLIVNGTKIFEQDSDDYFPLGLQTLVTSMVNPQPVLDAVRVGDRIMTKANGRSSESGVICFSENKNMCMTGPYGLREIIGAPGHNMDFTDYQDFKGSRVARRLSYTVGVGEGLNAQVTRLEELKSPDEGLFSVPQPSAPSVVLQEEDLRSRVLESHEIIWPQVLDGATEGAANFYLSLDRSGKVREVLPLHTANERANDSARRQIMKWKFRPVEKDGVPVQAESVLSFTLNTRKWGPPNPLTDAEVRKLVTNMAEPVFPPEVSSGATYNLHVAIDSEGYVIETIAGEGPLNMARACNQALAKWRFSPVLENGEPRPYRADILFKAP